MISKMIYPKIHLLIIQNPGWPGGTWNGGYTKISSYRLWKRF